MRVHGSIRIAQSLQVQPDKAASRNDDPLAIGPDGPTMADTVPVLNVAEDRKSVSTTDFVGSGVVTTAQPSTTTFDPPSYVKSMTTEEVMTLKKALQRPILVNTYTWSSAQGFGTNLGTMDVPEVLLQQTIVNRKLDGFQGIRGSVLVRVNVNANPMLQGILKCCFYPMYWFDPTFTYRMTAPECWSFFPSVELNLSVATACEMRIPFCMPVAFLNLVTNVANDRPQMGGFIPIVYAPLATGGGSTSVSVNVYMSFCDDLELLNPTPNVYQSGKTKKIVAQTDIEKKKTSLSESLAAGAEIGHLASAIPVLSDVAGPTGWALDVAARTAAAFGFSRPPIDEKPTFVVPMDYPYNGNVEGPDSSMPLSLTTRPLLRHEPTLAARTEDEMEIDTFVSRFGYRSIISFDNSVAANTMFFNILLGAPSSSVGELVAPKPYQILARSFAYYRGDMRIRLKFCKTKMHTARLVFAFFPGVLTNQTMAQSEYTHREIVDLASVDELVYQFPFTAQTPYLKTQDSSVLGCYGSFQCFVLNPLQYPSTVANQIQIIVETAFAEGSEWFCPSNYPKLLPTVPLNSGVAVKDKPLPPTGINQAQSGLTVPVTKITTLANTKSTGPQIETSQLCVGECIRSLRQLVKYFANPSQCAGFYGLSSGAGSFGPVYYNCFAMVASDPTGAQSYTAGDFIQLLGPYFRFSRGSMRVRGSLASPYQPGGTPKDITGVQSAWATISTDSGFCGSSLATNIPFGATTEAADTTTWSYTVPPWQLVPMIPHKYVSNSLSVPWSTNWGRQTCLKVQVLDTYGTDAIQFRVARAGGDDYEFLSFVGPPLFVAY